MELLRPVRPLAFSSSFTCRFSSSPPKIAFLCDFSRLRSPLRIVIPLGISSTSSRSTDTETWSDLEDLWRDSDSVEVIGIGSRKDAVLDFCLESPFQSVSLRFWTINMRDSQKVQLLQKSIRKDMVLRNVECLQSMKSYPRATILVASAGYGIDHVTAIELLNAVKSEGRLAVAIVLKPFSFEGKRRQQEVDDLVSKLQEGANFCVVVDTDALLKEVITLAEASRCANNVVLLAVNAISVLVPDRHPKLLDVPDEEFKEVKLSEVLTMLRSYNEAKVGFGAGCSVKSSISRAVFDCPFLSGSLKDLDGIVVCTITCAAVMDKSELQSFMRVFRQITKCTKQIIFSSIGEPNFEPNLVVTTLLVLGCNEPKASQKGGFLSGLALHFPFVLSFLRRDQPDSKDSISLASVGDPCPSEVLHSSNGGDMLDSNATYQSGEDVDMYSEELGTLLNNSYDEIYDLRMSDSQAERNGVGLSVANPDPVSPTFHPPNESMFWSFLSMLCDYELEQDRWSVDKLTCIRGFASGFLSDNVLPVSLQLLFYHDDMKCHFTNHELVPCPGEHAFQREPLNSWNVGPGFHTAKKWAQERAGAFQDTAKIDKLNIYTLPVGVKFFEQSTDGPNFSCPQPMEPKQLTDMEREALGGPFVPPWDALSDTSFEAIIEICNAASSFLKGKYKDLSAKQGFLSARAASMLEAERDPQKKWSPVLEMQYRGGIYRGRCQGGLPEGKGRLTLTDGSFYDGIWRYGKRSGLGTFYYSNGDVFQGSWRDDLMHGKGWFYFHTGDRWFANFWKGKANGEGRFYSKHGNIFFGHFQDGWRHGHSLCIDVDGTRWAEIWDEGVLVSRNKLDVEIDSQ